MFPAIAALAIGRRRFSDWRWPATVAAFTIALCGMLYFAYLTWLEIAVIGAICQWCVVAAAATVGLLVAESFIFAAATREPTGRRERRR
jgi:uncharacterized membrane protein